MSEDLGVDPIARFRADFARASKSEPFEAGRAALATATADGRPSVRYVLVKSVDDRGFPFYTNLRSPKVRDLEANPRAELCFHWFTLGQQVRVAGPVEPVEDAQADAYFAQRPRGSQLGAWASEQSQPIDSREALDAKVRAIAERFGDGPVPRPPFWSGLRVVPERIEFWIDGVDRLHDRFCYTRGPQSWRCERLQP